MTHLVPLALAALLAAGAGHDTVLLQNGGRVVGTVVEENPASGVTVQIPGGQLRTIPAAEVFRIEYRDGTFGVLGAKPGAPPPPAAPPPAPAEAAKAEPATPAAPAAAPEGAAPAADAPARAAPPPPAVAPGQEVYPAVPVHPQGPPPPPPPPWSGRPRAGRPGPVMLALGVGLAVPGGDAEAGYSMADTITPQFLIEMEAGLRFTPWVMGSLVLDLGVGDSAGSMRTACRTAGGTDCSAVTVRFGVQLRYAFEPMAPATAWVSLGTGVEATSVTLDASSSSDDFTYTGWEAIRLGAGYDFRTSPSAGLGLFANVGFGTYDEVEAGGVATSISSTRTHTWVQAGVRVILFP